MARPFESDRVGLVVFDAVGTTVADGGAGSSPVAAAWVEVFREAGIALEADDVEPFRGLDKREAVAALLHRQDPASGVPDAAAARLTERLLERIGAIVGALHEVEGTSAAFAFLRRRGIRVALASGLPHEMVVSIAERLGWTGRGLLDLVMSAESAGAGRPDPAMIRRAMADLGVADPSCVLKVGDTVADVLEGRNAGVWTAAVLTGMQSRAVLEAAGPDFVLESVADVPALFPRTDA